MKVRIFQLAQIIFLVSGISASGVSFWDNNERLRGLFFDDPHVNVREEEDFIEEIVRGHPIRDVEKHERQKHCPCVEHFFDPHCGSDMKEYDNGCFFTCAQKNNPGLRLKRWGKCQVHELPKNENDLVEVL